MFDVMSIHVRCVVCRTNLHFNVFNLLPKHTGDGCPLEKPVCYAIPDDECFGPSEETTTIATEVSSSSESPTPAPVRVCASTYDEAVANCRTNDQCENGDTTLCTDDTHACFTVSIFLCPPDESSSTSPTPTPRVCGTDAMDAQSNCLDEKKLCPTGGGCADGEACFNVLPNKCGVTTMATNSPTPAVDVTTASPTMLRGGDASTQAPSPAPVLKVCGANYTDASKNLCTYPQCPTGDVSDDIYDILACSTYLYVVSIFCYICSILYN